MVYYQDLQLYRLLVVTLLCIMVWCGWGITNRCGEDNRFFWWYAALAIAAYGLIEGLRFDRGHDYYHYAGEFLGVTRYQEDREPLWYLLRLLWRSCALPYWTIFLFLSTCIITTFMCLMRRLPKYAVWALPMMYMMQLVNFEGAMRQTMGVCFLVLAYASYIDRRWWLMLLWLLCVPLIHFSGAFAVAVFLLFLLVDPYKAIKWAWIPVVFYVAVATIVDTDMLARFSKVLAQYTPGDSTFFFKRATLYLENADRWFTDKGSISAMAGRKLSIAIVVQTIVTNAAIIYYGFRACNPRGGDGRLRIAYWMFLVGVTISSIGIDIELFIRFSSWIDIFGCFIVAAIMRRPDMATIHRWIALGLTALPIFLRWLYYFVIVPTQDKYGFVWDVMIFNPS